MLSGTSKFKIISEYLCIIRLVFLYQEKIPLICEYFIQVIRGQQNWKKRADKEGKPTTQIFTGFTGNA